MTRIVIDASAGAEIVVGSLKGRALARLLPAGAEGWVPEHFYAADALYVALAVHLDAALLTNDHRLVRSPAFQPSIEVISLPPLRR